MKTCLSGVVKLEPLEGVTASGGGLGATKTLRCNLVDRNYFDVQFDYDAELIKVLHTMNTRQYDAQTKRWRFRLSEHDELVKRLHARFNNGSLCIVPLIKAVRDVFRDQMAGKNAARFDSAFNLDHLKTRLDENVWKNLLPFQVESICFAVQQQGRLLLADDMGLGKTVQGLAIADYYKVHRTTFHICISRMVRNKSLLLTIM